MTSQPSGEFLPGPGTPGLVSVIVPCYNRADIVGETIDSILAQTYANLEIIIIDDGSTDNTRHVVGRYSDSRVRYFYKANGGLSAARNSGLDQAKGEFIAFLDSDYLWYSWKLDAQIRIFSSYPDVGLIWSDMSTFAESGAAVLSPRHLREYYSAYASIALESRHPPAGVLSDLLDSAPQEWARCPFYIADVFPYMFSGNLVHPSTAIVRRARLSKSGPFQPEVTGPGAEDYHFYFRICSMGPVGFMDVPTTLYRIHPSQLSTCNTLKEARGNLSVIRYWIDRQPETLPSGVIRRSLSNSHAWLGAEELNAGNTQVAVRHLLKSLTLNVAQFSTIRLLLIAILPRPVAYLMRSLKRTLRASVASPLAGLILLLIDDTNPVAELANFLQTAAVWGI
jgi:hypothetical protein